MKDRERERERDFSHQPTTTGGSFICATIALAPPCVALFLHTSPPSSSQMGTPQCCLACTSCPISKLIKQTQHYFSACLVCLLPHAASSKPSKPTAPSRRTCQFFVCTKHTKKCTYVQPSTHPVLSPSLSQFCVVKNGYCCC